MSGYRPIFKRIWKDPDFQSYSAEDKLLFVYLCTNEATNESGIYHITLKTIAFETNIPLQTVEQRLSNGCLKNVSYDVESHIVFVKNLRKYNTGGKPDLILKAINNEYMMSQHPFWKEFTNLYPMFQGIFNGCPTVLQPTDNLTITYNDTIKKKYGEFANVALTDVEHAKLTDKFGEKGVAAKIDMLSTAIESKGYKYKSHYATILNWDRRDSGAYKPSTGKLPSKYTKPDELLQ